MFRESVKLTFSSGSKAFKLLSNVQTKNKYKKSISSHEKRKIPVLGSCSRKVKTNNYSESTNKRALLLIKPQTKKPETQLKRKPNRNFPRSKIVGILSNSLVATYLIKKN